MRAEACWGERGVEATPVGASDVFDAAPLIAAPLSYQRLANSLQFGLPEGGPPRRATNPVAPQLFAAVASLALHAALLGALAWRVIPESAPTTTVEVELVSQSEAVPASAAPPIDRAPPQLETSPTIPTPTDGPAPAADREAVATPSASLETPSPSPTPTPIQQLTEAPAPTATPEASPTPRLAPEPSLQAATAPRAAGAAPAQVETPRNSPPKPRRTTPNRARSAASAPPAAATIVDGLGPTVAAARADYGALVLAQIHAHQFYPSAALDSRQSGDVGVQFVVAASGAIADVTITRSSGSAALDHAARTIIGAIELPPPPGGRYSGATQFDFVAP